MGNHTLGVKIDPSDINIYYSGLPLKTSALFFSGKLYIIQESNC